MKCEMVKPVEEMDWGRIDDEVPRCRPSKDQDKLHDRHSALEAERWALCAGCCRVHDPYNQFLTDESIFQQDISRERSGLDSWHSRVSEHQKLFFAEAWAAPHMMPAPGRLRIWSKSLWTPFRSNGAKPGSPRKHPFDQH